MSPTYQTTFGAAIALSTISAGVIIDDVSKHHLNGNVLTTACFVATAAAWIVWHTTITRQAFEAAVAQARRELHANNQVRHLKAAPHADN